MTRLTVFISCCASVLLSSCSSLQQHTPTAIPLAQYQPNQQLQRWQLQGKVGLRTATEANSASLYWQQCDEHFDIRLHGPLGMGTVQLSGNRQLTTLRYDNQTFYSSDPEQLLQQHTGWVMPVSALYYWIRGLPQPRVAQQPFGGSGFAQNGWQVDYTSSVAVNGFALPAKTRASSYSADVGQVDITLITRQWQLEPNCEIRP